VNGFTFDFAGLIMFSNDPGVHELYKTLLGDNVHWQDREAWIYTKNVYTRYPFQGSLYGLPAEVVAECILGAVECATGRTQTLSETNGNGKKPAAPQNFEDFIYNVWGRGIAEHFAIPYNRKLWAVPFRPISDTSGN
jgi:UDP-galactopyranose mutase